ncbi:MAG: hypothetical protein KBS86_01405 [Proteobacteria bacterium]|nr:hypothetical protein [Candidatus Enterousia scatequi]
MNQELKEIGERYQREVEQRMMTISGICVAAAVVVLVVSTLVDRYQRSGYVITDISDTHISVKNMYGQQRLLVVDDDMLKNSRYLRVGDTIRVYERMSAKKYKNRAFDVSGLHKNTIKVDKRLLKQRQEQAKFDSLKCAIARENQGKQR